MKEKKKISAQLIKLNVLNCQQDLDLSNHSAIIERKTI